MDNFFPSDNCFLPAQKPPVEAGTHCTGKAAKVSFARCSTWFYLGSTMYRVANSKFGVVNFRSSGYCYYLVRTPTGIKIKLYRGNI